MVPVRSLRNPLLFSVLLVVAALAGCAGDAPAPDGEDEVLDDEGGEASPTPTGSSGTPQEEPAAAATPGERFQAAFDALRENKGAPQRFLMTMEGLPTQREGAQVVQTLFVDAEAGRTAFRFLHTGADGRVSDDSFSAMLNQTLFEGKLNETLVAMYDAGAPAFEDYNAFGETAGRLPSFLPAYFAPSAMLQQATIFYAPAQTPQVEEVEVDGVEAERLTYARDRLVATLQKEPSRILSIQKEAQRSTGGTVNITITFDYAPEFPLMDTLARAASLSAMDANTSLQAVRGEFDSAKQRNWTILPGAGATVRLEDVELRVYGARDLDEAPLFTLPLENGSADDARFRLSFEDNDNDGLVSEGDTLHVELLATGRTMQNYGVRLVDEQTDAHVWLA